MAASEKKRSAARYLWWWSWTIFAFNVLHNLIFIEVLYLASVCAKKQSVWAIFHCAVSIFHPFPPHCLVFVEWSQGCTKTSVQTLARLLRSIIFIQLLYVASVCAKCQRVWAIIHCVVSIFHFFPLVCPVFVEWSQGCTKTSVQTLARLLRWIIFIQVLYVASVCTKFQSVWSSIHCAVSIFHPFPLCPVFVEWSQGSTQTSVQTLARLLRSIIFIQLLYLASVCAKCQRVWAIIHCVVSIFHFFPLLCPVFVDWSQGCTKTSVQTLARLLRSIIFIQLFYVAPVCA